MGRSRRKYKASRTKVRVGLPKKNPRIFKASFSIQPKLLHSVVHDDQPKWDDKGSVIYNSNSFDIVSNLTCSTLDLALASLEEDELRSALGKKRRDERTAALQPLTRMQRVHIGRLVNRYEDDYQDVDGYKAQSHAAFCLHFIQTLHHVSYVSK